MKSQNKPLPVLQIKGLNKKLKTSRVCHEDSE